MVLIDTGPIVALFDESEPAHEKCKSTLHSLQSPLITSWPVLTEAFYLLNDWQKGQDELWQFILNEGLQIVEVPANGHGRMRELMAKYSDNPMDLADATIVLLAEIHKIKTIFTLDIRDFSVYRPKHCKYFKIMPD